MNKTVKRLAATAVAASGLALGIAVLPTTPAAPAQAAYYEDCFVSITNQVWCYQYGCTAQEEFDGCYQGWVVVWTDWYA